jgi:hypothetical protein
MCFSSINSKIVWCACGSGEIAAVNTTDFSLINRFTIANSELLCVKATSGLLWIGAKNGDVYCLWDEIKGAPSAVSVDIGIEYYLTSSNTPLRFQFTTTSALVTSRLFTQFSPSLSAPITSICCERNLVFVGNENGNLFCIHYSIKKSRKLHDDILESVSTYYIDTSLMFSRVELTPALLLSSPSSSYSSSSFPKLVSKAILNIIRWSEFLVIHTHDGISVLKLWKGNYGDGMDGGDLVLECNPNQEKLSSRGDLRMLEIIDNDTRFLSVTPLTTSSSSSLSSSPSSSSSSTPVINKSHPIITPLPLSGLNFPSSFAHYFFVLFTSSPPLTILLEKKTFLWILTGGGLVGTYYPRVYLTLISFCVFLFFFFFFFFSTFRSLKSTSTS